MKEELKASLSAWFSEHNNPYDSGIKESAYWTMRDLSKMLSDPNVSDTTVECCKKIYDRFKYYY